MLQVTNLDGGEAVLSTEISPEKLAELQKEIDREQKIQVGPPGKKQDEYTVDELIDAVLAADGWKASNKNYMKDVFNPVRDIFYNADVNLAKFGMLFNPIQYSRDNPIRNNLLASAGQSKIFDFHSQLMHPLALELFDDPKQAHEVFDRVWPITGQIGNISVGSGEIALSLFSDAIKGERGDLSFEGIGEVEVKGSGARMGKQGYAVDHAPTQLSKILKDRDVDVAEYRTNQAKQAVINWLDQSILSLNKTASYKVGQKMNANQQ